MDLNKENSTCEYFGKEEEEEEIETLSLCNLTMQEYRDSSVLQSPRDSSAQDFFEFYNDLSPESYSAPDIIFCGKIVNEGEDDSQELNEYQKRDYLATVRSHSFRRPSTYDEYPILNDEIDIPTAKSSSDSLRLSSSKSHQHVPAGYHVQNVNITSLTSMSAKSRRRMFMFGPVKFKPEMELSSIKERQGRRLSMMMFPAPVLEGGKAVVSGGGKAGGIGKRNHWNIVRLLRGRTHLTTMLTRSLGCIPAASVGKWIKVAN